MVSQWKTDTEALIQTIANGHSDDQATKDAVAELTQRLGTDENGENDFRTQEASDVNEIKSVISDMIAKLQAGDTAGAISAGTAAVAPTGTNTATNSNTPDSTSESPAS